MTVLLVLFTLITFLACDHAVQRYRARALATSRATATRRGAALLPQGIALATNHTWVKQNTDGSVTIGLDEFMSRLIGSVERLTLPLAGEALVPATSRLALATNGRTLQLAAPVHGNVLETNLDVLRNPSLMRQDPYGKGWLLRVSSKNRTAAMGGSYMVQRPGEWLNEQFSLVRDFLAQNSRTEMALVLQEGGEPVEGILQQFDQKTWKEFGAKFATLQDEGIGHEVGS
jgi:glycine cleavage system H lipoate-binding protein